MQTIKIESFGKTVSGRLITSSTPHGLYFVQARNPYGSHNLVVVDEEFRAIRHGNNAALNWAPNERCYRKLLTHLANRAN
jgi:hypothetical protein